MASIQSKQSLTCPNCKHPEHTGKVCGWHKTVIDGELYDTGDKCTCDPITKAVKELTCANCGHAESFHVVEDDHSYCVGNMATARSIPRCRCRGFKHIIND